jgi:hypothetical protein
MNSCCNYLTAKHACSYLNNLEGYTSSSPGTALDIEDLVSLGRRDRVCPYFLAREGVEQADIVFLPYNYLLDSSIRLTLKVDWQHAIVIFDEAHNLEKIASDAASFSLSSSDLATCISELQKVLTFLQKMPDLASQGSDKISDAVMRSIEIPDLQVTASLLNSLFNLEAFIAQVPLSKRPDIKDTSGKDSVCAVLPGDWMVQALQAAGFHFSMVCL